ncbi:MAG: type IV pilus modification PilV family protein [Longimicrobiaceae bacterium]
MATKRADHGFTLLEVLVALVILSIGLLALQGLSLAAIRTLGFAEAESEFALAASQNLETALGEIRSGLLPDQTTAGECLLQPFGDELSRQVNAGDPNLPVITVTVTPSDGRSPQPPSFQIQGSVYVPDDNLPLAASSDDPC